ncbi:MAG: SUMF1/EgtB/PvdO family nonheme iron enzyme [Candidatus Nitrotoga sp.]
MTSTTEWVDDWYQPYKVSTYRSEYYGTTEKDICGSSASFWHYALPMFFRTTLRAHMTPDRFSKDLGFRCAK